MPLVPDTNTGKIEFFDSKVGTGRPWTVNSAAIGSSPAAVTSLGTKIATAKTKLANAVAAKESAKNATAEMRAAIRDMVTAGGDIIKAVRSKAATDGEGIY